MATENRYRLGDSPIVRTLKNTEKDQRIREFRNEASRKASLANKRIERLERNKLTDSPAYQRWVEDGGAKFGVRGKSFNQVQAEMARLDRFIKSESSTVRGANNMLKELAENTGIKYKNMTDLREKAPKFFELSSKVEQYLRTVDDMASAIGYQKIWETINEYTKEANVDLGDSEADIDSMIEQITDAIKEYDDPLKDRVNVTGQSVNWYKLKD